jgi:hypothetical protein
MQSLATHSHFRQGHLAEKSPPPGHAQVFFATNQKLNISNNAFSADEPQWDATIGTAPGEWGVVRHA